MVGKKSPTALHSHWSIAATPSDLPNVSGASVQDGALEVGDRAYVTSTSKSYACTLATLGAATWATMDADADAIHDNVAGEIAAIATKNPTADDLMLIEDVADTDAKKSITCGDLPTGAATDTDAIHDNVAAEISAVAQKTVTALDDLILIEDSEAANVKKRLALKNYPRKGSASNLWLPPSVAHSEDDEFDGASLSSWYAYNHSTADFESFVTGLDAYDGTYSGDDIRYSLNPSTRRSWLLTQVPNAISFMMGKMITAPTNLLIVARLKLNHYYSAMTASDRGFGLRIREDSSGEPTGSNVVSMLLNYSPSGIVRAQYVAVGTGTIDTTTTDVDAQGQALEYVAIHKIGTTYHGWVGTAAGNWIYMGNVTKATAMTHVGLYFYNATTTLPGLGVFGADFIRFFETDNFLF